MKIKKILGPQEFDIVSLVDAVFLLLVFGLVVMAIEINVGKVPELGKAEALRLQIFRKDFQVAQSSIILPGERGLDTLDFPADDTLRLMSASQLQMTPTAKQIRDRISTYVPLLYASSDTITLEIEPRTLFCLVGLVLEDCGSHGDSLPSIRVVARQDIGGVTDAPQAR